MAKFKVVNGQSYIRHWGRWYSLIHNIAMGIEFIRREVTDDE